MSTLFVYMSCTPDRNADFLEVLGKHIINSDDSFMQVGARLSDALAPMRPKADSIASFKAANLNRSSFIYGCTTRYSDSDRIAYTGSTTDAFASIGQQSIVIDGEITNIEVIRSTYNLPTSQTVAETMLHYYNMLMRSPNQTPINIGEAFLRECSGTFSLIVYDAAQRRLIVCQNGIPLYIRSIPGTDLVICSEVLKLDNTYPTSNFNQIPTGTVNIVNVKSMAVTETSRRATHALKNTAVPLPDVNKMLLVTDTQLGLEVGGLLTLLQRRMSYTKFSGQLGMCVCSVGSEKNPSIEIFRDMYTNIIKSYNPTMTPAQLFTSTCDLSNMAITGSVAALNDAAPKYNGLTQHGRAGIIAYQALMAALSLGYGKIGIINTAKYNTKLITVLRSLIDTVSPSHIPVIPFFTNYDYHQVVLYVHDVNMKHIASLTDCMTPERASENNSPNKRVKSCGECVGCIRRQRAFVAASLIDPAKYDISYSSDDRYNKRVSRINVGEIKYNHADGAYRVNSFEESVIADALANTR